MAGKQVLSLWDYDKESAGVTIPTVEIDATNLVAQSAFMDTFIVAVDAVSLGVIYKDVRTFVDDQIAGTPPIDKLAQREKKWLVRMTGNTSFKPYTMTIPGADLSLLDDQNKGNMDSGHASYSLIESAIENFYYGDGGEGVTVQEIIFVGRNL